jgi:hypothetical protein
MCSAADDGGAVKDDELGEQLNRSVRLIKDGDATAPLNNGRGSSLLRVVSASGAAGLDHILQFGVLGLVVGGEVPAGIAARAGVVLQPSAEPVRVAAFQLIEQALTEFDQLVAGRHRRHIV